MYYTAFMETHLPPREPITSPGTPLDETVAPKGVQIYDRPASIDARGPRFSPLVMALVMLVLLMVGIIPVLMWLF